MANQNTEVREKLYEEYEDSLFRLIMHSASEKEGKLFLDEVAKLKDNPENQPSAEAIRKFGQQLDVSGKKDRSRKKDRSVRRFINKAAVFFLLLIVVFSTAMVTVQALRVKVMNFLIDIQPEYTSFQIKDNASGSGGEKLSVNWTNTYLPTYIPAGYEVDSLAVEIGFFQSVFRNHQFIRHVGILPVKRVLFLNIPMLDEIDGHTLSSIDNIGGGFATVEFTEQGDFFNQLDKGIFHQIIDIVFAAHHFVNSAADKCVIVLIQIHHVSFIIVVFYRGQYHRYHCVNSS